MLLSPRAAGSQRVGRSMRSSRPHTRAPPSDLVVAPRAAGRSGTATGPDWSLPDDANVAGFDPMEEVGVPRDQRPVNELKSLRETFLYAWAALPPQQLGGRLAGFFAGVTALLSAPIAGATFDVSREPAQLCLAASAASLAVLLVLLLRIYLGWEYVGKRLLSAVVEYEETGWYDGQTFVKPPKVLARDRLLGAYEVRPVLAKLQALLGGGALALGAASAALIVLTSTGDDAVVGQEPRLTREGIVYRSPLADEEDEENTEDELNNGLSILRYDDAKANAEAAAIRAAIGEVPAYCVDRYAHAVAGASVDCDALIARAKQLL